MADRINLGKRALQGLNDFAKDCSAATAIEYALIAAGISTAILISVTNVGSQVVILFTTVSSSF